MTNHKSEPTEVTLVLGCLKETIFTPIKYWHSNAHEIYVIGRAPLFLSYIEALLQKHINDNVLVVLVYGDILTLLEVLLVLHKVSKTGDLAAYKEKYLALYKHQITRDSGGKVGGRGEIKHPKGHNDVPLAFKLAIVQLCDGLDRLDHLSEGNVAIQQLLRFLALIHGGVYAGVSGLSKIADDGPQLAALAGDLVNRAIDPEMHIYDVNGSKWALGVVIHQLTPPGWDSWSKIELAAQTILRDSHRHMLDNGDAFDTLYEAYTNYCAHEETAQENDLKAVLAKYVEIPGNSETAEHPVLLTYSDAVSLVANGRI